MNNIVEVILSKRPQLNNVQFREEEPQEIKIRSQNNSIIFIDTEERLNKNQSPVDLLLNSVNNTLFTSNIVRLAVRNLIMSWITPNVNERNNVVTFFSSVSGTTHTVTVPEGFYGNPTILMDALVTALNTATGASGLTFSHAIPTTNPIISTLSSAGGNYYFDLNCLAVTKGKQLWNLPLDQVATNNKVVGSINGLYTRYVDIHSKTLTQYSKNPNSSNARGQINLLYRVYLEYDLFGAPQYIRNNIQNGIGINFNPSTNISNIDLKLNDEFGDLLYIPQYASGTDSGFFLDIAFITET